MKFDAVVFDCDGVLADSESISAAVLRDMFEEMGRVMSFETVARHFVGKTMKNELGWITQQTGVAVDAHWLATFQARRNDALRMRLDPVPGAPAAVAALHAATAGRIACASSGDRLKIELQLDRIGLLDYFRGRMFSGYEVPQSKPAPDVYLAAMRALQVDPARCLVVEDSVPGVQAGVAAGATVYAYCAGNAPDGMEHHLLGAGAALVVREMGALPALALG
ncbi:MAG: HAD family phosphatase [Comamonadaceae bacterium]|nr:MAG: HAD family phosphatase [Comamonadaceae bacterium]